MMFLRMLVKGEEDEDVDNDGVEQPLDALFVVEM